jgi:hypothetical protein
VNTKKRKRKRIRPIDDESKERKKERKKPRTTTTPPTIAKRTGQHLLASPIFMFLFTPFFLAS